MARILVVDDEQHMQKILATNLQQEGHVVFQAGGVEEAKAQLASTQLDVVITDQKMPDGTGLDVLRLVQQDDPTTSVIFLTAVGSIELAVESMRGGAFDFLTKPFLPEVLCASARRAEEHTNLLRDNNRLRATVVRLEGSAEIVGRNAGIQKVREQIARVAATDVTVLIRGETGTGKELVARAIHKSSLRAKKPFVAVNCAGLAESLLESELFGHERGAFTGADRAREGLFEAAHQGTLFLDEIGELSAAAQAKLLRVLTEGEVLRVGNTRPRKVDVRVLAATHRDLEARVRENLFREDLFYRLAIFPILIPPLRERRDDIPELADMFLRRAALEWKLPPRKISAGAMSALKNYEFPGNVRELRNIIERACILADGEEISENGFANLAPVPQIRKGETNECGQDWAESLPDSIDLRKLLVSMEKKLIERALAASNGSQAEAARRLGLSRSDLSYKLRKHELRASAE
ncbi:MAG TPA: sigma-54 dependent transcriptional regulator [Terriglobales bacterium]|nr:sigma-54 dependent transcriptional regulator [Terriglobales bacterium]